jgi:hypothetical protein
MHAIIIAKGRLNAPIRTMDPDRDATVGVGASVRDSVAVGTFVAGLTDPTVKDVYMPAL